MKKGEFFGSKVETNSTKEFLRTKWGTTKKTTPKGKEKGGIHKQNGKKWRNIKGDVNLPNLQRDKTTLPTASTG